MTVLPGRVELAIAEESGGPVRCRPSAEACDLVAEGCVSSPVVMPMGIETQVHLQLRSLEGEGALGPVFLGVSLQSPAATARVLDAPVSGQALAPGSDYHVSVGITPTLPGPTAVDVHVEFDAANVAGDIPVSVQFIIDGR